MDCQFSIPLNFEGNPPIAGEPFQYQIVSCDTPQIFTLIKNETTGAEFYLDKTLSYGDLILIIFLSFFLIFGIVKFLWNFVWTDPRSKI